MSRSFNGSSDKLAISSALVTSTPFTASVWFFIDNTTANGALFSLGNNATNNQRMYSDCRGSEAGPPADPVLVQHLDNALTAGNARTTAGYSATTWHHFAGVWTSSTSRTVYLDAGNSATDTTSVSTTTVNVTGLGVLERQTPSNFFPGDLAEFGLWSVVLSTDEIAALAKGVSPQMIRPQSLVSYSPLIGKTSPEQNLISQTGWTVTGATAAPHCRIYRE